MSFIPGEGPMRTWECPKCKIQEVKGDDIFEKIVGFRRTPIGLILVKDLVGRYALRKKES